VIPRSCRTQIATAALAMNPYASNIHAAEQASQLVHQKVIPCVLVFVRAFAELCFPERVVVVSLDGFRLSISHPSNTPSSLQGEYRAGGRVHTRAQPGCPIREAPPAAPARQLH